MSNQEETYECSAVIEFEYLEKLGLLDNIEFKYIKGYLPFDESHFIDFEWQHKCKLTQTKGSLMSNNMCDWDVKYKFTLENEKKNIKKTFSGVFENIHTTWYIDYIFMKIDTYCDSGRREREEETYE